MEINSINTIKMTEQFDIKNVSKNINAINETLDTNKFSIEDIITKNNIYKDKSFVSNVTTNLSNIMELSIAKRQLSSQSNILKDMSSTIKSSSSQQELDANYTTLLASSSGYNSISSSLSSKINLSDSDEESLQSRIFFDGIPGSKPLSFKEISQAVEEQSALNKYINAEVDIKMKELISNTMDEIKTQQHESIKNDILKSVDFDYESKNFATQKFLDMSYQMVDSQSKSASNIDITTIIS